MSLLFPQQRSPLINHIPPNNGNMGLPLVALLSPFLRAKRRLVPQWTIIPRAARHCVPWNNTLERWRCSQGQRSDKKKTFPRRSAGRACTRRVLLPKPGRDAAENSPTEGCDRAEGQTSSASRQPGSQPGSQPGRMARPFTPADREQTLAFYTNNPHQPGAA